MAADSSWLRILSGPRTRTPCHDVEQDQQIGTLDQLYRRPQPPKTPYRLPSWNNPSFDPFIHQLPSNATDHTRSGLYVNEADRVWHAPSVDQVVEFLQAIVMAKSRVEPLGVQHISLVTRLIEGYRMLKRELASVQKDLAKEEEVREEQNRDFEELAQNWTVQEELYKAEIKRLESVLRDTSSAGLEAVSLARPGSLLKRRDDIAKAKPRASILYQAMAEGECASHDTSEPNQKKQLGAQRPEAVFEKHEADQYSYNQVSHSTPLDLHNDVAVSQHISSLRPHITISNKHGKRSKAGVEPPEVAATCAPDQMGAISESTIQKGQTLPGLRQMNNSENMDREEATTTHRRPLSTPLAGNTPGRSRDFSFVPGDDGKL